MYCVLCFVFCVCVSLKCSFCARVHVHMHVLRCSVLVKEERWGGFDLVLFFIRHPVVNTRVVLGVVVIVLEFLIVPQECFRLGINICGYANRFDKID